MWHPLLSPFCMATTMLCLQGAASSHANGTRPAGRAPGACPGLPLRGDKLAAGPAPRHAHAASSTPNAQRCRAGVLPARRGGHQTTSSSPGFGAVAEGEGELGGGPKAANLGLLRKACGAEQEILIPPDESCFWSDSVWSFGCRACSCLTLELHLLPCGVALPLCQATTVLVTLLAALQLLARRMKSCQRGRDSSQQGKERCPGSSLGTVWRAADPECAICLQPYQAHELLKLLPCSHAYHSSCIDRWHRAQHGAKTCPLCLRTVTTVALIPLGARGCEQE